MTANIYFGTHPFNLYFQKQFMARNSMIYNLIMFFLINPSILANIPKVLFMKCMELDNCIHLDGYLHSLITLQFYFVFVVLCCLLMDERKKIPGKLQFAITSQLTSSCQISVIFFQTLDLPLGLKPQLNVSIPQRLILIQLPNQSHLDNSHMTLNNSN